MRIKTVVLLVIVAIALVAVFYDRFAVPGNPPPPPVPVTTPTASKTADEPVFAPTFQVQGLDGGIITLYDLPERVILLNFWASWCMPCLQEFPSLLKRVEEADGQIGLLAISGDANRADAEKLVAMLQKKHTQGKTPPHVYWAWDGSQKIATGLFNTVKLPETILIGPDRELVAKFIGGVNWSSEEVNRELDPLLADPAP